jgi:hypothetical protein
MSRFSARWAALLAVCVLLGAVGAAAGPDSFVKTAIATGGYDFTEHTSMTTLGQSVVGLGE